MYKVNFACLFFGYLNRNSHAHEHFTCTGTLPVPVHRYRGILRSLLFPSKMPLHHTFMLKISVLAYKREKICLFMLIKFQSNVNFGS